MQDEREGKRLRRKQSNRESARRSRLRKQAESESLNSRVEALQAENSQLREENGQLRERLDALQPELVRCLTQRQAGRCDSHMHEHIPAFSCSTRQPAE